MDRGGGKQISIAQLLDPDNLICLRIYTCCEGRRSHVNKWCED